MIPRELSRIALEAMAREPEERYADVPSFQAALRDYLTHEESLRLTDEGRRRLDQLEEPGAVPLEGRYTVYTEALGSYRQALHLWEENEVASAGKARAHHAFAEEALNRGDLGLAEAQVSLLASSPGADRSRLETLQNTVSRRTALRRRSRLALVAAVGLLVLTWQTVSRWNEQSEQRKQVNEAAATLETAGSEAWKASLNGDLVAFRAARHELEGIRDHVDYRERTRWLDWAHEVLLWRLGRWEEFSGNVMTASRQKTETFSDAIPRGSGACSELLRRPELAGTHVARRLASICGGTDPPANDELWPLLLEAAADGLHPDALAVIDEQWEQWEAARFADAGSIRSDVQSHLAVVRSAVWSMARQTALDGSDLGAARRCEERIVPYRLSAPPFGPTAESKSAASLRPNRRAPLLSGSCSRTTNRGSPTTRPPGIPAGELCP
jgi:hypothetical protein